MGVHFRSFRSRLVVVFLGLFALIQATGYFAVTAFVRASARHTVDDELRLASTLFARQLDVRTQQLVAATRLLSGDFALKTAVATADHATTASVLENHRRRVDAGVLELDGGEHLVRIEPVGRDVVVVLQRPLAEALAPYDRMLLILLAVAAAGVLLALLGAALVARRVSRPVLTLARGARRVAAGDFDVAVKVPQRDELGELARTFNEMVGGLRERERVRDELERTAKLKRFFSPQLADALSAGDESLLASHRRQITVVFCDLRGFTAFAEAADPEEVMRLLHEYHATIGPLVFAQQGTLERFTGDGLMVFFNDPVPCPDPAARAVRMAVAMRDAVATLLAEWRRRGHALGFGTGIAMGDATIGRIGFEGRFDYAAIGTVTNLSARLCQEARDGQILVSEPVHAEVESLVEAKNVGPLPLRGFARPIVVFDVLGLRPQPTEPP